MQSPNFYSSLKPLERFDSLSEDHFFKGVPSDWFLVISDIVGSTQAIQAGRYRDVNTLGAASIAIVQEAMGAEEFPFVFGGDGATFLVPHHAIDAVKSALQSLQLQARKQFQFNLRVGVMPISEVFAQGHTLEVARFALTSKSATALLRGGGLQWAESQIKTKPEHYCLKQEEALAQEQNLKGISCRWQPLASQHGVIVSLLIQPRTLTTTSLFKGLLASIAEILGGPIESASPVQTSSMIYKPFWQSVRSEWSLNDKKLSRVFVARVFEIMLSVWAFKWGLPVPFNAHAYVRQIPSHSDYRKYDDMLRLILDCTVEQAAQIEALLEMQMIEGHIYFGLHKSTHALMTCLVENLSEGGHIHFIDGSDGGYARASQSLKKQAARAHGRLTHAA